VNWRKAAINTALDWDQAVSKYRKKLESDGLREGAVDRTLRSIDSYGEAELYDKIYADSPRFNTKPNKLLVSAVKDRPAGEALDVAMGQGRNSIFLAMQGWQVTGFDVAEAGLAKARQLAESGGVKIKTVLSSDEDFDFGQSRWDLIVAIYAMEKRSVHRIRNALKPGGMVVVEAGHKSASGAPFEYESNELLRIFKGFRILRHEEVTDLPDWGKGPIRIVRIVAEKPR
ncbi:MAG: methyltransferase domain-containing protein, partial [Bryobacteraceae bacterium]|nr:methyltransferase domain-containing protein [Bryobacteraceae bacterium]